VGHALRIFVVDIWWPQTGSRSRALTFINPNITPLDRATQRTQEGCLSLPGVHEFVTRSSRIEVEAIGADGQPFKMQADGLLAVCIQHENDHLDGLTFLDRLGRLQRSAALKEYNRANTRIEP
jgi:peptide deformylase